MSKEKAKAKVKAIVGRGALRKGGKVIDFKEKDERFFKSVDDATDWALKECSVISHPIEGSDCGFKVFTEGGALWRVFNWGDT